ncbi:dUTP diphosphatase [Malaciobacter mytili]|uniref:Deoxyuridinetriphosphatase n=1 Tax=Malaciobacter mytili LMG 24559 TaxID=1032238 RepID=A0AAX2AGG7_9BACT|nr:dUTP diphosphatase [Malaciobacter mytili]AXH14984.1 dUTPase, dimeric [Malaciobacter mytili LMG 24559]RXI43472.1 deoxyuridinetriphosphatase [Malaciobacter mytili]RXK14998.1 deoxyuridinetriphosphatase [Malaciobacter mytili LMG 24559]
MLYEDLKIATKSLGFLTIEDFAKYIGVTPKDILEWEQKEEVPYTISLIIHLLKGDKSLPNNSTLDNLVEECLPLATLLEEASSFPHKLEEMFLLQKELNDSTNGKNWELGINKFDKEINWLRCIHMEVSELIESTPWKHWKNINAEPDMNNIHVELVDIWHFLMSYILQETNVPKAVSLVNTHCIYEANEEIDVKAMVKEAEKLSYIALAIQTNNMPSFSGIERFIDQFFRCCKISGLSFTWLQKLYIGKNCLNKFRQDNGYKEGTYKKDWNGKEDNVVMVSFLEKMENVSFNELYKQLELSYKSL